MKLFSEICLLAFLLTLPHISSAQTTMFVGHRGASHLAPENTLASIELAWKKGADAAECDVMLTADNQVVVFHDKRGKRLTGENFIVKESAYREIRDLPILLKESNLEKYSGQTIPLLSQVLSTIPEERTLVIEIKTGPEIMPYLEKEIDAHWNTGKLAFISFDFETILVAKEYYPEVPCFYLSMFRRDVNTKKEAILKGGLDGVNLRHKIIDEELVNTFNSSGLEVWCWTVNDPADARRLIEAGVSAITTDRPAWLKEQVL